MKKEKKTRRLPPIRVTESQYVYIQKLAESKNIPLATFLRNTIMRISTLETNDSAYRSALREQLDRVEEKLGELCALHPCVPTQGDGQMLGGQSVSSEEPEIRYSFYEPRPPGGAR